MKRKMVWTIAVFVLIPLLAFTAWGEEKGKKGQGEPITIGYIQSLTGIASRQPGLEQAQFAVEEINNAGGILGRPVKLLVRDDEFQPATASKVIRELHDQHGVNLFFGITNSANSLALVPYLEQTNSLLIVCAAHSTKITGKNFSSNVFRITDNGGMRARAFAQLARQKYPDVHKWSGVLADYEYGWNCWENFKKGMKELDPKFEEAAVRAIPMNVTSGFGPHITSVIESGAQGVYNVLSLAQSMNYRAEAASFGFFDKVKVLLQANQDERETRALGKMITHDYWTAIHWVQAGYSNPVSKKFLEGYNRRFGEDLSLATINQGAASYDGMYAYKHAIEKAGKLDVDSIRTALEGLRFESICGEKYIRPEDHQAMYKIALHCIGPDRDSKYGYRYKDVVHVDAADPFVWPLAVARSQ